MATSPRVDVTGAIAKAKQTCAQLFAPRATHIQLEEVEQSEDGSSWLVTLSFSSSAPTDVFVAGLTRKREYKVFKVDGATGNVVSIKIRALETGGH